MIEKGTGIIKTAYTRAAGDGKYIVLYLISLVLLFIYIKDKKNKTALLTYSLIAIIVIFNPISAYLIGKIINQGSNVYWRLFWIIPIGLSIAYIFTEIVFLNENKYKRIFIGIFLIGIIIYSGTTIYQKHIFQKVDNLYKIPDDELLAVQVMLEDAKNIKIENPKASVPTEMVAHVRQIDSKLRISYKRNPAGGEENYVEELIHLRDNNFEKAVQSAKKKGINYIVWYNSSLIEGIDDLKLLSITNNYAIYKVNY